LDALLQPEVLANLLFLSVVASMVCFLTWNWCIGRLGAVQATNWVYLNPIATIVAAWLVLDEEITAYFLIGSILILLGMYVSERKGTSPSPSEGGERKKRR
jgi:drug/metabolite transporter (DMT)-like permease